MPGFPSSVIQFIEAVEQRFNRNSLDSFWACKDHFQVLVRSGFVKELLQNELRKIVLDPAYRGDWRPHQIRLVSGQAFNLVVALVNESRRYIHTIPYHAMYAAVGDEPLRFDLYGLPEGFRDDVFDPSLRLTFLQAAQIEPGEVLLIDGTRFACDFKIERPVLVVHFYTASFATLEWLFSKDNLHAWQANDAELSSTQLRVACHILGRIAHQSSLEPLLQMTEHPHHSVRWAAIQNLARLNHAAAFSALQKATNDRHPHVKRAAIRSLQQLAARSE